ncbi:MAG: hypothetical protein IPJ25_13540 [Rhodocyclaceae bacterium]|nr:hypothetical protein [Rhodocyclaceae bacterium]
MLAWYRLNDLELPAGAQDAFSYAEVQGSANNSPPTVILWGEEAKVAAPELMPDFSGHTESGLLYGNNWDTFENCPSDAWSQARKTYAERLRLWGTNSAALRDWLVGQHRVFARCALGPSYYRTDLPNGRRINPVYAKQFVLPDMSLPDPPPDAPKLLVKDRAYQRASAFFYEGHYEEAESAFFEIAKDTSSPWRGFGSYLALRARLRAIEITPAVQPSRYDSSCKSDECEQRRADFRSYRNTEAIRLRTDVKLSIAMANKSGNAEEVRRLTNLDSLIGARLDPAKQFRELATELMRPGIDAVAFRRVATDYLHLHRQFPPSEPLGEWLSGLIDGRDPTGAPCASASTPTKTVSDSPLPEEARCLRQQWSEKSLTRFLKQPTQYAWLFSAAALAERDDPHLALLLKTLAAVPDKQAGATSFLLHRLRLGGRDEGQPLATALLKRPDVRADYSARNRVREYRMWYAEDLQEFWADSPREIGTAFDRDTLLTSAPPNATDAPRFGSDYDTHWILNYELPHAALLETARRSGWPESQRGAIARMAWARAVLRKDATAAREALAVVADISQKELLPNIESLREIKDEKTFLIEGGLIAIGSAISADCHLNAPKVGEYTPVYAESTGELKRYFGRFAKRLLTPDAYADWQHERLDLEALPDLDSAWMQNVINFATTFPEDARAPSLLREAVYKTRMNWCAEPSAGKLSKTAFDLLKRSYPKSKEARTTKYWFKPRM